MKKALAGPCLPSDDDEDCLHETGIKIAKQCWQKFVELERVYAGE